MGDSCSWGLLHNEISLAGCDQEVAGRHLSPHRANSDWGAPHLLLQIHELHYGSSDEDEEVVEEEEACNSAGSVT